MKILVTGSSGQLGHHFKVYSSETTHNWFFPNRHDLNFLNKKQIISYLNLINPNIIFNCAAYTDVDNAEKNFEIAKKVNFEAVKIIANWCLLKNCRLIQFSSDYVFDGQSKIPLNDKSKTNPINGYGKTKLLAENICKSIDLEYVIIRTSWLFSGIGKNFVKNIIKQSYIKEKIYVVDDEYGQPTSALELAKFCVRKLLTFPKIKGVFNYTNSKLISRYDYAVHIKKIYGFESEIIPVSSKSFSDKAMRPKFINLDFTKTRDTFKIFQPNLNHSLTKCINSIKNEK